MKSFLQRGVVLVQVVCLLADPSWARVSARPIGVVRAGIAAAGRVDEQAVTPYLLSPLHAFQKAGRTFSTFLENSTWHGRRHHPGGKLFSWWELFLLWRHGVAHFPRGEFMPVLSAGGSDGPERPAQSARPVEPSPRRPSDDGLTVDETGLSPAGRMPLLTHIHDEGYLENLQTAVKADPQAAELSRIYYLEMAAAYGLAAQALDSADYQGIVSEEQFKDAAALLSDFLARFDTIPGEISLENLPEPMKWPYVFLRNEVRNRLGAIGTLMWRLKNRGANTVEINFGEILRDAHRGVLAALEAQRLAAFGVPIDAETTFAARYSGITPNGFGLAAEASRGSPVPVDLNELIRPLAGLFGVREGVTVSEIIEPDSRWVLADPSSLSAVLHHLISDAVSRGGATAITLSTGRDPADPGKVRIRVDDNGTGEGGAGLDLRKCRQNVEAAGGTITVDSLTRREYAQIEVKEVDSPDVRRNSRFPAVLAAVARSYKVAEEKLGQLEEALERQDDADVKARLARLREDIPPLIQVIQDFQNKFGAESDENRTLHFLGHRASGLYVRILRMEDKWEDYEDQHRRQWVRDYRDNARRMAAIYGRLAEGRRIEVGTTFEVTLPAAPPESGGLVRALAWLMTASGAAAGYLALHAGGGEAASMICALPAAFLQLPVTPLSLAASAVLSIGGSFVLARPIHRGRLRSAS